MNYSEEQTFYFGYSDASVIKMTGDLSYELKHSYKNYCHTWRRWYWRRWQVLDVGFIGKLWRNGFEHIMLIDSWCNVLEVDGGHGGKADALSRVVHVLGEVRM